MAFVRSDVLLKYINIFYFILFYLFQVLIVLIENVIRFCLISGATLPIDLNMDFGNKSRVMHVLQVALAGNVPDRR